MKRNEISFNSSFHRISFCIPFPASAPVSFLALQYKYYYYYGNNPQEREQIETVQSKVYTLYSPRQT